MIKKAITFRAGSLGDALMGKYFLENVHAAYPSARCFLLVGSRAGMLKELFKAYPWLTVIEASRRNYRSLVDAWKLLRGADLALTQYAEKPFSLPSKLFARLVTRRGGFFGFADGWWGNSLLYDTIVPFSGEAKSDGPIAEEQKALRALHIPVALPHFSLAYAKDAEVFKKFSLMPDGYVLAHLFSGSEGRNMSQEKRTDIVQALASQLPEGRLLVLTGGKEDRERTEKAARGAKNVLVLAGKTSIIALINLIANAHVVLALNTGAAHIALHIGVPTVVMSHKGGKSWFGAAMYGDAPFVLSADADDAAPRALVHPPSLERIDTEEIVRQVVARLTL